MLQFMKVSQSLKGHFLIAEPELGDPNFLQTVVLLISHDKEGAFGLVINRKSGMSLGEAAPLYRNSPFSKVPLYVGGPVEQEYLFSLHSGFEGMENSPHAQFVSDGLFFEPQFAKLEKAILNEPSRQPPEMRLFAGYSGWGPGQLEQELEQSTWVVIPVNADLIFRTKAEEGWKDALRKMGGVYWAAAETGYKPSMN